MKIICSDQLYHPPRRGTAVRRPLPRRQEEKAEVKAGDTVPAFQKIKDAAPVLGISQYRLRQLVRESAVPFIRSGSTYYANQGTVPDDKENILKRDFETETINQKWCTDITYANQGIKARERGRKTAQKSRECKYVANKSHNTLLRCLRQ